mmetsp:Transcript_38350/g.67299  ORF Transcript_38350/g.67299 Transcript_38350/m.67299 type:complete len:92 (-) Transcript_38350:151-426(-)
MRIILWYQCFYSLLTDSSLFSFAVATSLILAFLSGEQFVLTAVLEASVVSLFVTRYVPFIKSQLARSDIDFSLYYRKNRQPKVHGSVPTAV